MFLAESARPETFFQDRYDTLVPASRIVPIFAVRRVEDEG